MRTAAPRHAFAKPVRGSGFALRGAIVAATIVGIGIALHRAGPLNAATIGALLRHVGWSGLLSYGLYSLSTFFPMGASWLLVMGQPWTQWLGFTWARMLRESASDLLPFSQIGGMVIGASSLTARGIPTAAVYAGMTADLTTEMISQALFTVLGIALFTSAWTGMASPASRLAIEVGLVIMSLVAVVAWTAPRWIPSFAPKILKWVMPQSLPFVEEVSDRLGVMYARPARMAGSIFINFFAWTMSAAGAWIVLRFMGADLSLSRTISLEALIFALRSVAFMVPGGIGVQEAAYVLFAPAFGLPLETALVLAFAKRCKDVVIGLPTLVVWQLVELRSLGGSLRRTRMERSIPDVSR